MLIKEYVSVLRVIWVKSKGPLKFEFSFMKNANYDYIKSFNFKKYLKKDVFNNEDYFWNFIYFITFFFIFKIIYDLLVFIFYTIDLYITFFLKWFFYIIYFSLDRWETYIFKKIYEVRKDLVKSKLYKRENAILIKKRAVFFKQFISRFDSDYDVCLKFNKRNYSILLKYYTYFLIWIPALLKWFKSLFRFNIRFSWYKLNSRVYKFIFNKKWIRRGLLLIIFILKILFKVFNFIKVFYVFLLELFTRFFKFFIDKYKVISFAYKWRKQKRSNYYAFLYINYFIFYKRKNKIEDDVFVTFKQYDLIKYTSEAMLLTSNFYSLNFKFIYFWHCYIKEIAYFTYLEKMYESIDPKSKAIRDYKDARIIYISFFVYFTNWLSKKLKKFIPIFDKYYIKYVIILKKYLSRYSYNFFVIISYILTPFIFVYSCYKNTKEFFRFFIPFVKFFFTKKK